jgi:AcrR family transcriptional regulator
MSATARLPRGRHSLSREEVARSQRERLARAMADVMAEKGYARTTVADILRAAGVSRESFYEQFASKEDCFMSAFEEAYALLVAGTAEGTPDGEETDPQVRFEHVLGAYLEALAENPAYARMFLVEVHAAGPEALARRAELQRGLAAAVAFSMDARDEEQRFAVEAVLASITTLVTARLIAGDVDGLRALHAPLVAFARKAWGS